MKHGYAVDGCIAVTSAGKKNLNHNTMTDNRYRVVFTDGTAEEADDVNVLDSGWLNVRWEPLEYGEDRENPVCWMKYPPHKIDHVETYIGGDRE